MDKVAKITAQLNNFKTLKDGGYRITFDFGMDCLSEAQKILKWNANGEANFALAIVPFNEPSRHSDQIVTNEIDAG